MRTTVRSVGQDYEGEPARPRGQRSIAQPIGRGLAAIALGTSMGFGSGAAAGGELGGALVGWIAFSLTATALLGLHARRTRLSEAGERPLVSMERPAPA